MANIVKIEGHPHLVRDRKSGSILSVDRDGFSQFRAKKQERLHQAQKLKCLEDEIANLKNLVNNLVQKLNT